jgi:hypothetical protein
MTSGPFCGVRCRTRVDTTGRYVGSRHGRMLRGDDVVLRQAVADRGDFLSQTSLDAAVGTADLTARALTPNGQAIAVSQLICDLTLRRGLLDPYPQIVCYRATFRLILRIPGSTLDLQGADGIHLGDFCPPDLRILQRLAPVVVEPRATGVVHEIQVGSASIVVLPSWDQATFEALDDQSWGLAAFGHLLRHGYYEILSELRGADPRDSRASGPRLEPSVVLVDQVRVERPWRGLQLGLVGTGLALRELRRDCAFAVLYPMQPELATHTERTASRRRLTRYWSRLGFTHPQEHHLVLDLTTTDLDTRLDLLTGTAGAR